MDIESNMDVQGDDQEDEVIIVTYSTDCIEDEMRELERLKNSVGFYEKCLDCDKRQNCLMGERLRLKSQQQLREREALAISKETPEERMNRILRDCMGE